MGSLNETIEFDLNLQETQGQTVCSIYDSHDALCFFTLSTQILSDFPWLHILTTDYDEIQISSDVSINGVLYEQKEHKIDILTPDVLGMNMMGESAHIQSKVPQQDDWMELPDNIRWVFGDRPFMRCSDFSSRSDVMREACRTGICDEETIRFIITHTSKSKEKLPIYSSYGQYYDESLVQKLRPTLASLRLGVEFLFDNLTISTSETNGRISLINNSCKNLDIIIQMRIGDRQAAYILHIESDTLPSTIYLGTRTSRIFQRDIESSSDISVNISRLYNETDRWPIWCESDRLETTLDTPLWVLVSNEGTIPAEPAVLIKTIEGTLISGQLNTVNSVDSLIFGTSMTKIRATKDSEIFIEYSIL